MNWVARFLFVTSLGTLGIGCGRAQPVGADDGSVDLSGYRADCGVAVQHAPPLLSIAWPLGNGEFGRLTLDTQRQSLVKMIGVSKRADE